MDSRVRQGSRQLMNNDKALDWPIAGQSKERILSLCYEHPPLGGGGGRVARSLNDRLAGLGFHVDQVSMRFAPAAGSTVQGNVVVHPVEVHRRDPIICTAIEMAPYIVRSTMRALSLMRQGQYDYNLSHFIFPDGLACLALKWRTRLPYVVIAHGSDVPGYNPHRFKLLHRFL